VIDYFCFSKDDAEQYGVDGAVMLHHIRYWVAKNEANENNYHENMYWTYNSTKAFSQLFPFWSARKIGRILSKLEDDGAIMSGNFNGSRYDRTRWFTLANPITENDTLHLSKMVNGNTAIVEPIPKYNHITTQNTTKEKVVMPFEGELFADAWQIWKQYKKIEKGFGFKSSISEQASLLNLQKISNNEQEAITIIHNAIAQGWSGLYADKKDKRKKGFDKEKYLAHLDTL
jgi:hypothetical protein